MADQPNYDAGALIPQEDTPRKLYQQPAPTKPDPDVFQGIPNPESVFNSPGKPLDQQSYFSNRRTAPSRRSQLRSMGRSQEGGLRSDLPQY